MKRFRRWLFNVLAGLSLLLCVATAVLWVRSYGHSDFIECIISKPTRWLPTTPKQVADWDRVQKQTGWKSLFSYRCAATACANGTWYVFWGTDGNATSRYQDVAPPRIQCGTNCNKILSVDSEAMCSESSLLLGFSCVRWDLSRRFGPGGLFYRIGIPFWAVLLFALILPAWVVQRHIALHRRQQHGLCAVCGH